MWDMTPTCVRHDTFVCGAGFVCCNTLQHTAASCVGWDSFACGILCVLVFMFVPVSVCVLVCDALLRYAS